MRIEAHCSKCDKELEIKRGVVSLNTLSDIVIEVVPCDNMDCFDCSKCEEKKNFDNLKKKFDEISDKLESLTTESVNILKEFE